MFVALRFLWIDRDHTDTARIKKQFENFPEALDWINRSCGNCAAGAEIFDADTWHTLYTIGRDGVHEDLRRE